MLSEKLLEAAGNSTQPTYIEDVFSTYLYTGTGAAQTITNGIDLSGKGGMVWSKKRTFSGDAGNDIHSIVDTNRGYSKYIYTNLTNAEATATNRITGFNANGYSLGSDSSLTVNQNTQSFVSWTFRKQPKFFDIVTYTGDGASSRAISHNLGSVPGCIIVKRTNNVGNWETYHRELNGGVNPQNCKILLNSTGAQTVGTGAWASTSPTSSVFYTNGTANTNDSGATYVAYLFAHDAGGFGLSGNDNVISCGSFDVVNGVSTAVNLGYEPQFVLIKRTDGVGDWRITDNMRGFMASNRGPLLSPNTSNAEVAGDSPLYITSTGFNTITTSATLTYIYIAIRRGPMKTPTTGTEVFAPTAYTGDGQSGNRVSTTVGCDAILHNGLNCGAGINWYNRLIGNGRYEITYSDAAEQTDGPTYGLTNLWNSSFQFGSSAGATINNANTYSYYTFTRAPGFFDEVCYTGTGNPLTLNHNLGVAPELIIYKARSSGYSWIVQSSAMNVVSDYLILNATSAKGTTMTWRTPTSTTFGVNMSGNVSECNYAGTTYVAYLFASCPGVSKVFSFTGNGSSQTINCSFTTGARFILIKRTDSTGDWYVWDSARGIVSGNDPHLSLNTTAAEVTTDDTIDPDSTGFIVNQVAATNVNVNAATYIGIAIA